MWHQLSNLKPEEGKNVIVCTYNAKVFIGTLDTSYNKDKWRIDKYYLNEICDYDTDTLEGKIPASIFDYWTEVPLWYSEV